MISAQSMSRRDLEIIKNLLSQQALDASIKVHSTLGARGY
jgi:hypothetical protein